MLARDFRWIALLLVIINLVVLFVIIQPHINSHKERTVLVQPYRQLTEKIQRETQIQPLVNIYLRPRADKCPEHHERERIGQFSGFREGCQCPEEELPRIGTCQPEDLEKNCTPVQEIDARPFYFWDGENQVCVRRTDSANVHYKTNSNEKCPDGFKKCSSFFCLREIPGLQCPFVDYRFAEENSAEERELIRADYKLKQNDVVSRTGKKYVAYYKEGDETTGDAYFINNFRVDINSEPCYNTDFTPKRNNDKIYPLERDSHSGCDDDKEFGPNVNQFIRSSSVPENVFYDLNNFDNRLPQHFLNFARDNQDQTVLFAKRQIRLTNYSPAMMAFRIFDNFEIVDSNIQDFEEDLRVSTIVFYILFAVGFISLLIILIGPHGKFGYAVALICALFLLFASLSWAISYIILAPKRNEAYDRSNAPELKNYAGSKDLKLIGILQERTYTAIEDYEKILYAILICGVIGVIVFTICLILLEYVEKEHKTVIQESIHKSIVSPHRQDGGYRRVEDEQYNSSQRYQQY